MKPVNSLSATLPMNLKMQLLIIKHLRILRFMGAMRAKRFRGSLILTQAAALALAGELVILLQVQVSSLLTLPKLTSKASHVVHAAQSRIAGKFGVAVVSIVSTPHAGRLEGASDRADCGGIRPKTAPVESHCKSGTCSCVTWKDPFTFTIPSLRELALIPIARTGLTLLPFSPGFLACFAGT